LVELYSSGQGWDLVVWFDVWYWTHSLYEQRDSYKSRKRLWAVTFNESLLIEMHTKFYWEEAQWKRDQSIDWTIILKIYVGEIVFDLMGWNQSAQDSVQRRAFVNIVMNLGNREFHGHKHNCQVARKNPASWSLLIDQGLDLF
jgi:hypothetical protein